MKLLKILFILTISVNILNGLSFNERKNRLIKILQTDVGHRSSYSYHRHHHHHHHHHYGSDSSSASLGSKEKRRLINALYLRSNPRYYNDYPGEDLIWIMEILIINWKYFWKFLGAYQPYNSLPYGYSYYTTPTPLFGLLGWKSMEL